MNRIAGCSIVLGLAAASQAQLIKTTVLTGLPSALQYRPDPVRADRAYAVIQTGTIRTLVNGANTSAYLTIPAGAMSNDGERGLLGMAFAPDFATSRHVYVNFTDQNGSTQISRFTEVNGALDYATRHDILNVAQPFANHNGGTINFGNDRFLYIGMGDGGSGFDPGNRAQTPSTLLGKFLRIDPTGDDFPGSPTQNYAIPTSNPFFGADALGARDEIWSFGWRNPFKWSFDSFGTGATHAMLAGDVGQNAWEEIDHEPFGVGGRNYGWVPREGRHDTGRGSAAYGPLHDPIFEYGHNIGETIIGGVIYRGSALPSFYRGRYFYADYISRKLWSLGLTIGANGEATADPTPLDHTQEMQGVGPIVSIDIGQTGEIYVVEHTGRIFRIDAAPVPEPTSIVVLGGLALALRASRRRQRV
jgi:glucose/arabinose dehydrogenase